MMCYKDRTFCEFYENCKYADECGYKLTPEVILKAEQLGLYISRYVEKPSCYEEQNT